MRLAVFSHKPCWVSCFSQTGVATDGGFPVQIEALSSIFQVTRVLVPVSTDPRVTGETQIKGKNLSIVRLSPRYGKQFLSKLSFAPWLIWNLPKLLLEGVCADAIYAPIPGDVGSIGMGLGIILRKKLLVRHCGNWDKPITAAEKLWKWLMVTFAGGRFVMLATGGGLTGPSDKNPNVKWIFSTSLSRQQMASLRCIRGIRGRGSLRLIHVGRQEHAKGAGSVIAALLIVAKRFPQVHLDVVGDGPAVPEFRRMVSSLGLVESVTFWGKLSQADVLCLLRNSDLFCFPTCSSEGFPKAVLEALACGLPVVTTAVSVLPNLISRGCGIIIDGYDSQSVADGILMCTVNNQVYQRMSCTAVEVAADYSLENWVAAIRHHCLTAWDIDS